MFAQGCQPFKSILNLAAFAKVGNPLTHSVINLLNKVTALLNIHSTFTLLLKWLFNNSLFALHLYSLKQNL
jgi:hypothetical protein